MKSTCVGASQGVGSGGGDRAENERAKSAVESIHSTVKGVGVVFVALLVLVVLISVRWIDHVPFLLKTSSSSSSSRSSSTVTEKQRSSHYDHARPKRIPISFACPNGTSVEHLSCTRRSPPPITAAAGTGTKTCPGYFRYIHEDLRAWRGAEGITRAAVEEARRFAHFRLVVLGGRAYVERYARPYQTRDVFTLWGILQLLARRPGLVPDLDLMFNCEDPPLVLLDRYRRRPDAPPLPPLFRYCKDQASADIVFPDWSFWGWPEIKIKPWELLLEDLEKGNERVKWKDREPYAFWKGNPSVSPSREDLLKCNVSNGQEYKARLFTQDWDSETQNGFKKSDLASQCVYRYKIYIDGKSWSVSEKYILACDSPMLLVTTPYQDFFTRGLMPGHHYWPIKPDRKCQSIKFAVDWGNSHPDEAQAIGKAGSGYIQEEVKMDYVYDYMLHLLTEYAKLLRYKPTVPEKATKLCLESMACAAEGLEKTFMMDSMAKWVDDSDPCTIPPPFDPKELEEMSRKRHEAIKQVEMWENSYS